MPEDVSCFQPNFRTLTFSDVEIPFILIHAAWNYKHGFSGSTLFWINTEVGADLRCQANNKRHWHMPTKQQSAGVYARKPARQPKEPHKPKDFIIIYL